MLALASTSRMDIRRIQTIKNGDEAVGNRTKFKAVNKMQRLAPNERP